MTNETKRHDDLTPEEHIALVKISHELEKLKSRESTYELIGVLRDYSEQMIENFKRLGVIKEPDYITYLRKAFFIPLRSSSSDQKTNSRYIALLIEEELLPSLDRNTLHLETIRTFISKELGIDYEDMSRDRVTGYSYYRDSIKRALDYLVNRGVLYRKERGVYCRVVESERNTKKMTDMPIRWKKMPK